jgi:hypothetical protein
MKEKEFPIHELFLDGSGHERRQASRAAEALDCDLQGQRATGVASESADLDAYAERLQLVVYRIV